MPDHARLSAFEGGLNVPLVIAVPAVTEPGAECAGLVNTTDLFSTILDLAGARIPEELRPADSVSLVPYLGAPSRPSLRNRVYAESFTPNGLGTPETSHRAIRGERFKLIRTRDNPDEDQLYDLWRDPFETVDLLGPEQPILHGMAAIAHHELRNQLGELFFGVGSTR